MLRPLEVFIKNDGQMNETAKQLYIHRNAAAYRLEKIGELLEAPMRAKREAVLAK